jgi:DNA-binding response OmpR family regulator/Tfp pilus assembly protein PilF
MALMVAPQRPAGGSPSRPDRTPELAPSLLLVGAGTELQEALARALDRHGMFVESCAAEGVEASVVTAAPDLVLLAGDAARDDGVAVLRRLSSSPLTSVIPVALLADEAGVDHRLQAFRHGAVSVIARTASIDAIADQVANLARQMPERSTSNLGNLGESTLKDFVEAMAHQLRAGILSVRGGDSGEEVRLVLGDGRPIAELVDDFVQRVKSHVVSAEPLHYEFDERAAGTLAWLGASDGPAAANLQHLRGVSIALADADAVRADTMAQALRDHGATVMVTDLAPHESELQRLRQLDPNLLVIGDDDVLGEGYDLVRRMKAESRLRWAALLVVRWAEICPERGGIPSLDRLSTRVHELTLARRVLRERLQSDSPTVDLRLDSVGPSHLLRELVRGKRTLRLTLTHPRLSATVDISDDLIVGAVATRPDHPSDLLEGPRALAAVLQLGSGRAHVERVTQPATTNLMAPLDVALGLADAEPPPLPPSLAPSPAEMAPELLAQRIPPAPSLPSIAAVARPHAPQQPSAPTRPVEPHAAHQIDIAAARPSGRSSERTGTLGAPLATETRAREMTPPREATVQLVPAAAHPATRGPAGGGLAVLEPVLLWLQQRLPPRDGIRSRRLALLLSGGLCGAVPTLVLGLTLGGLTPSSEATQGTAPVRSEGRLTAPTATTTAPLVPASLPAPPAAAPVARAPAGPSQSVPTASGPIATVHSDPRVPEPIATTPHSQSCADLGAKVTERLSDVPGAAFVEIKRARRGIIQGDIESAQIAYCRALAIDPDEATAHAELARIYMLRRDASAALGEVRAAIKLSPSNRILQGIEGDALARLGNHTSAREGWCAEAGVDPANPRSLPGLAETFINQARGQVRNRAWNEAERFYRRAAVLTPDDTRALVGMAQALSQLGELERAALWAKAALDTPGLAKGEIPGLKRLVSRAAELGK